MIEETPPRDEPPVLPNPEHARAIKYKWLAGIFCAATLVCAVGWYNAYNPMAENGVYKNYTGSWGNEGTVYSERWNANGNRSAVWLDLNYDFNFEKISTFNFSDNRITEAFDDNEDGHMERVLSYSPSGDLIQESFDADGNGCAERVITYHDKLKIEFTDLDANCVFDSIKVHSGERVVNQLTFQDLEQFLAGDTATKGEILLKDAGQ
jgi:hypothetical protein